MMCVDSALRPGRFFDNIKQMACLATDGEYGVMLHQNDFRTPGVLESIKIFRPRYINYWPRVGDTNEILTKSTVYSSDRGFKELESDPFILHTLQNLAEHSKIIIRMFGPENSKLENLVSAFELKSEDSAGWFGFKTKQELLESFASKNKPMIVLGGVGTPQQVKEMLTSGAAAVGIGTLFAVTHESELSETAKQKIIQARSQDLYDWGLRQRILNVDETQHSYIGEDVWAKNTTPGYLYRVTLSRYKQALETGQGGHLYIGPAVDYVDRELSVAELVAHITQEL